MKRVIASGAFLITICAAGVYLVFGQSALQRDAAAVGKLLAAMPYCEFTPRRGAVDVYFGKYDWDRTQSEEFETALEVSRNQEQALIADLRDDQKAEYCLQMREFARDLPFGLQE